MQEELNQFEKSNVWSFVPRPKTVLKILNCIKWMPKVHF
ncbi:hypothetical protein CFOL_v3_30096 [Cephalotus follicularis]|uniref:Uncharacterized protein n=1 Tax=Cephalotus follicularis TaxID=3775 RepID=A0A1Q3D2G7_CEPFO|nr:hypothetical protein CFOL_v3_30096 [Cephalotus follicularis]